MTSLITQRSLVQIQPPQPIQSKRLKVAFGLQKTVPKTPRNPTLSGNLQCFRFSFPLCRKNHLHHGAVCLPLFRHVSIPVFHGCAYLRMTHQLLLHADRGSAGIEHRTVAVPKSVPAKSLDSKFPSCRNKDVSLQHGSVPDSASIRVGKNPALLTGRTPGLPSQKDLSKRGVQRHLVLAVFGFHPTDPSVYGSSGDHQRAVFKIKVDPLQSQNLAHPEAQTHRNYHHGPKWLIELLADLL